MNFQITCHAGYAYDSMFINIEIINAQHAFESNLGFEVFYFPAIMRSAPSHLQPSVEAQALPKVVIKSTTRIKFHSQPTLIENGILCVIDIIMEWKCVHVKGKLFQ